MLHNHVTANLHYKNYGRIIKHIGTFPRNCPEAFYNLKTALWANYTHVEEKLTTPAYKT